MDVSVLLLPLYSWLLFLALTLAKRGRRFVQQ